MIFRRRSLLRLATAATAPKVWTTKQSLQTLPTTAVLQRAAVFFWPSRFVDEIVPSSMIGAGLRSKNLHTKWDMKSNYRQVSLSFLVMLLGAAALPAAEIGLAGTDPIVTLPTNPPAFAFSVDQSGYYTNEYENTSTYTFLNLVITGSASGISTVGCSPGTIFSGCSASIDATANVVRFFFSGGNGVAPSSYFYLTATNFVPNEVLFGTSTQTQQTSMPEPATVVLTLTAALVMLVMVRSRNSLKVRIAGE